MTRNSGRWMCSCLRQSSEPSRLCVFWLDNFHWLSRGSVALSLLSSSLPRAELFVLRHSHPPALPALGMRPGASERAPLVEAPAKSEGESSCTFTPARGRTRRLVLSEHSFAISNIAQLQQATASSSCVTCQFTCAVRSSFTGWWIPTRRDTATSIAW